MYSISFPGKLFWKKYILLKWIEFDAWYFYFLLLQTERASRLPWSQRFFLIYTLVIKRGEKSRKTSGIRVLTTQSTTLTSAPVVVQRMETQTGPIDKWECYSKKQGEICRIGWFHWGLNLLLSSFKTFVWFVLYLYFG